MENTFQVQPKIALLVQSRSLSGEFTLFKKIRDITPGSESVLLSEEITCNNISYFLYNDPFKIFN